MLIVKEALPPPVLAVIVACVPALRDKAVAVNVPEEDPATTFNVAGTDT
jgi:hypothetical protein